MPFCCGCGAPLLDPLGRFCRNCGKPVLAIGVGANRINANSPAGTHTNRRRGWLILAFIAIALLLTLATNDDAKDRDIAKQAVMNGFVPLSKEYRDSAWSTEKGSCNGCWNVRYTGNFMSASIKADWEVRIRDGKVQSIVPKSPQAENAFIKAESRKRIEELLDWVLPEIQASINPYAEQIGELVVLPEKCPSNETAECYDVTQAIRVAPKNLGLVNPYVWRVKITPQEYSVEPMEVNSRRISTMRAANRMRQQSNDYERKLKQDLSDRLGYPVE